MNASRTAALSLSLSHSRTKTLSRIYSICRAPFFQLCILTIKYFTIWILGYHFNIYALISILEFATLKKKYFKGVGWGVVITTPITLKQLLHLENDKMKIKSRFVNKKSDTQMKRITFDLFPIWQKKNKSQKSKVIAEKLN